MTRKSLGTPEAVIASALLAFVVVGILFGGAGSGSNNRKDAAAVVAAEVRPIALRVQLIRGVRFKRIPRPVVVTPGQTRAAQLRDLDRGYPAARRRADAQLLELLGLVPPGTDLRKLLGDISREQVAGYYDTHHKRLAIVDGPAAANGTLAEIAMAHELNHALEDQRFGLHENPAAGADDGASAYTALVEGTATSVMNEYAQRFISPGAALVSAFAALGPSAQATSSIPPYIQRSLEFSYTGGERFIASLRAVDGGGWKLVNSALRGHPPVSTEQVIHPDKYMKDERPRPVAIGRLGLGPGWQRDSSGSLGEFDTRELMKLGVDDAAAATAAAGWGGGRYEMWTNAAASRKCADPCRAGEVLVLRWAWDTPLDAREFDAALPLYLARGLKARGAGTLRWAVGTGGAAAGVRGNSTTLAFAPSPDAAARVAAAAGRR